ncbi:MAG: aminotransferase class I/II-fold pyridoxal phosphate-dependent enzyme [candidate division Zixibacteria bacterium]|nr:aminotransferase class I/II-fold pyridoxal phosphate-dependent enzyme [candidate division Zixibacteria bacterium]
MRLETLLVHAGGEPDPATGALTPPIHLSTTFTHTQDGQATHRHVYIRDSNPTQDRLEEALCAAEGGEAAVAFASGMAAASTLLQTLPTGSHVLMHTDVYTHVRVAGQQFLPRWNCSASHVDMTEPDAVRRALRPETRMLWLETPSNPCMDIIDIAEIARIAREIGALTVVDSTFATPICQQPLAVGADIVLHSTTKYLGGHSDVQGGALVFRKCDEQVTQTLFTRKVMGAVSSPFNTWLVLRGLRSLSCRVERHSDNAMAVAAFLETHPAVEKVHYPGLASHPGHETARRQMRRFGGMLSFQVRGGHETAFRMISRLGVFTVATSLGGTESLLEHRASIEGPASTTPDNLLRVSVGLEAAEDLIADLDQALT